MHEGGVFVGHYGILMAKNFLIYGTSHSLVVITCIGWFVPACGPRYM